MEKQSKQASKSNPSAPAAETPKSKASLQWYQKAFLAIALTWLCLISSLSIPSIQRNFIFMHRIRVPLNAEYNLPEKYGLSPHKSLNLYINSTDNVTLGAWFTFSDPYFTSPSFNSTNISDALKTYPTALYLHGNAATRAVRARVSLYSTFSSRIHVNILAIDYRGFGDSTGSPTEEGTIQDALAAFDWLVFQGADPKNILIMGHSLGSAIAAQAAARLELKRGIKVRGVVLMSGFTNLRDVLETFTLLGVPIFAPTRFIPGAWQLLLRLLKTDYSTVDCISSITSPIMLVHAKYDGEIPSSHSLSLFDKLLEQFLPPAPPAFKSLSPTTSQKVFESIQQQHREYSRLREELIVTSRVKGDAIVRNQFNNKGNGRMRAVFLETLWGGHNRVALQEGVQDVIKEVFFI